MQEASPFMADRKLSLPQQMALFPRGLCYHSVLVQKDNVDRFLLPAFTVTDHSVSLPKRPLGSQDWAWARKEGLEKSLLDPQSFQLCIVLASLVLLVNSLDRFKPYILFLIINRA